MVAPDTDLTVAWDGTHGGLASEINELPAESMLVLWANRLKGRRHLRVIQIVLAQT